MTSSRTAAIDTFVRTSADRCDSCGAPAHVRADFLSTGSDTVVGPPSSLLLCKRHYLHDEGTLHEHAWKLSFQVAPHTHWSESYRILSASDRCDAGNCDTHANARIEFVTGNDEHGEARISLLYFCTHHWMKWKVKLIEKSVSYLDETEDALF